MNEGQGFFTRNEKWLLLLLLPFAYALFFHELGDRDLWSPDEDEYLQVNIEMVRDGNWIHPTIFGEPYSIKPPLFNWIGSGFSLLAGGVTELTSRLPSAFAATLGLFALYPLGRMLFGRRAAYLAVLALATSPLYVEFGRWIQINMISTVLLTATLTCFWWGYTNERRRTPAYLLMYAATALGTLDMGAVNAAMSAIVIGSYLIVVKDYRHFWQLRIVRGLLVFAAVAGPWYLAVTREAGYAQDLLVTTNFTRFFTEWQHTRPFYYYLHTTPPYFLPWVLYLPGALYLMFSGRAQQDRARLLFPFAWSVSLLLFFSLSQTKRSEYVLPVFPAMALLVGYGIDRALSSWDDVWLRLRLFTWPTRVIQGVAVVLGVGVLLWAAIFSRDWLAIVVPFAGIAGLGAWASHRLLRREQGLRAVVTIALAGAVLVAYGAGPYVAKLNERNSAKPFCLAILPYLEPEAPLKLFQFYKPMYGVYTDRFIEVEQDTEALARWLDVDEPRFFVTRERVYERLADDFPVELHVVVRRFIDHRYVVLLSNRPAPDSAAGATPAAAPSA